MFNLTGSEIVVILLLALVVLGPEKLPDAIRRFGRTYSELKRMGTGFQQEFRSAIDEPMREMRDSADMLRKSADFSADGVQDRPRRTDTPPDTGSAATSVPATPPVVRPADDPPADDPPHVDSPTLDLPFGEVEQPAQHEPAQHEPASDGEHDPR